MRFLPRRFAPVIAGVALAVTMSVFAVAPALADGPEVDANLTGGSLSESTTATPVVNATLDGTDQTPTYTVPMTVIDATGSGDGWELTITSTLLDDGNGHTFSATATKITGVTKSCAASTTCTDPTNSISYSTPLTVPAAAEAPEAVVFYNAAEDTGMGKFTITPTMQLKIPANAYAGEYTSTITLAIDNGPA